MRKICESVFEIFWDEVLIARNAVKTGQYLICYAVNFSKRSAFEMQFRDFFPNWDQASKKSYRNYIISMCNQSIGVSLFYQYI